MLNPFLRKVIPLLRGLSFDGEKGRIFRVEKNPEKISGINHHINQSPEKKFVHPPFCLDIPGELAWSNHHIDVICPTIIKKHQNFLHQFHHTPRVILLGKDVILFSGSTYQECLDIQKDPFLVFEKIPMVQKYSAHPQEDILPNVEGKVIVVTGGAQGIGACLVRNLVKLNAFLFIADINQEGAEQFARELNQSTGKKCALPIHVDVTDEKSVREMVEEIINNAGGVDVFINNAGVLKAGSVKDMEYSTFQFVNQVNYFGYFLCTKHVSRVMAWQNRANPDYLTDIIQINSKSGLEGSNKNCAYAGSKFAGIGLTQSLAKELIKDHIKVNSICPGNFFEGPLWSDPQDGLFVQYLESGKVPGAKNIDDVRQFYESKVPMGRGCQCRDIVKAVLYVIAQKYETGQAIPITGGQVMLG